MIPREAIEKAMEGDFGADKWILIEVYGRSIVIQFQSKIAEQPYVTWAIERIALDPTFWQALGKALKWKEEPNNYQIEYKRLHRDGSVTTEFRNPIDGWHEAALAFNDLILTGGDTQAFWDDLLK